MRGTRCAGLHGSRLIFVLVSVRLPHYITVQISLLGAVNVAVVVRAVKRFAAVIRGECPIESRIMTEDLESRRRRAGYRASHRGTKEMDWILGRFAERALPAMTGEALARFERLLVLPDPELQEMILDPHATPGAEFADLIAQLRVFHGLERA